MSSSVKVALQRCLNSPYLRENSAKSGESAVEFEKARGYLENARAAFDDDDEATGYKRIWAAVFHAARALVYRAGYDVDQLKCMEIALRAHYESIGDEEIRVMRQAQELVGPPEAALERAAAFLGRATALG